MGRPGDPTTATKPELTTSTDTAGWLKRGPGRQESGGEGARSVFMHTASVGMRPSKARNSFCNWNLCKKELDSVCISKHLDIPYFKKVQKFKYFEALLELERYVWKGLLVVEN